MFWTDVVSEVDFRFFFFIKATDVAAHGINVSGLPRVVWKGNVDSASHERWGAGVETQKNVRGEIGGWGRVPFNETYAPSLSTIYAGA